jgi:cytidylate kinase
LAKRLVIAIDGPASSGKSVVGALVAKKLGYVYFDTGALYRAVTAVALNRSIRVENEAAVNALAENIDIDVIKPTKDDGRQYTVLADGQDITWGLVKPETDANVSVVAAYPTVRAALLGMQRTIAAQGNIVMIGRDIGTVVVPTADLKIYLTASPEVRAQRRYLQALERGQSVKYEDVLENVKMRDRIDSGRATAPLRPAEDAVVIDSSNMTLEQEVAQITELAYQRGYQQEE